MDWVPRGEGLDKVTTEFKAQRNSWIMFTRRILPLRFGGILLTGKTSTITSNKRSFSSIIGIVNASSNKYRSVVVAFGAATTAISFIAYVTLRKRQTHVKCEEQGPRTAETNDVVNTNCDTSTPCCKQLRNSSSFRRAIEESRDFLQQVREETGAPGLVVAVSVDGKLVWSEGLGYADVENNVKCSPKSIMRIASISKPLAALAVAKLYEENKLDLDAPVQQYVPSFPQKYYKGQKVTITTRQLLSHLGGIRHYHKQTTTNDDNDIKKQKDEKNLTKLEKLENVTKSTEKIQQKDEYDENENYIKEPKTINESLALFQDDPLVGEPGESYLYTTHGYTLVSAVVQSAAQEDFLSYMGKLFRELGMSDTSPELKDKILYNRARFYSRGKKNGLVNVPYVDNSYKWAGGGFMSTAPDLVKFGNAMLYAKQSSPRENTLPGILKPETMREMWKKVEKNEVKAHKDGWYGWGWFVLPRKQTHGVCRLQKETVFHTGEAIGAVSILLLRPGNPDNHALPPRGIVVSIIMNVHDISRRMQGIGESVADIFDKDIEAQNHNI